MNKNNQRLTTKMEGQIHKIEIANIRDWEKKVRKESRNGERKKSDMRENGSVQWTIALSTYFKIYSPLSELIWN